VTKPQFDGLPLGPLAPWFRAFGFPQPQEEYRFHPTRMWRFDYCWPEWKIALEINGGIWSRGRHVRGVGFMRDMEKLNVGQIMGWLVLQFPPQKFKSGEAAITIREALEARGWKLLSLGVP